MFAGAVVLCVVLEVALLAVPLWRPRLRVTTPPEGTGPTSWTIATHIACARSRLPCALLWSALKPVRQRGVGVTGGVDLLRRPQAFEGQPPAPMMGAP